MGIWSSIRDFYQRWKPEIDLYGVGFLLFGSALVLDKYKAAWVVLGCVLVMDAMRRWGEPYRQIGKAEMERRRRVNKAYWDDRFGQWFSRFHPEPPPAEPPQPAPTTHVIPNPMRDGEEPPESPAPIQIAEKPPAIIPPPVTHDT
ncbi:hypothetical protein EI77_02567 [Prosthecobacter fusiformis]|uniref:Uncharacterized protein n=1 Tax=Prosthecobacter fusiformis TaxID=48464 RepID=A0A4V3FFN5_9BACT|nr:hypothetical protein [Prosthecobacter fusiformis]TDU71443.1 hypothetical protein EI77_02567 [Prosthecobacter fusiformis]